MKQAKNRQKAILDGKLPAIAALSAALSFILLLFSPVIVYMEDPAAFMVDFPHLFFPMLGAAFAGTLIIGGLLCLMLVIHRNAYIFLSRLFLGLLLAFTVQSFLLNGMMNVVLSSDVRYPRYRARVIFDNTVFFLLVLLPLILTILSHYFPSRKLRTAAGEGGLIAAAAVLAFMHMSTAAVKTVGTDFGKYKGIQNYYLSYEPTMSLSEKENVVVFLADRLDSLWMDEMLEKYPELYDKFEGFTFYQNTLSTGTSTFPTVPQMLTNCEYKDGDWAPYLTEAWSGDTLPAELKKNGWDVYLLPDRITCLSSPAQVMGQCDNIKRYDTGRKTRFFGKYGMGLTMLRLSAARMLPYNLKHDVTYWLGANFCRGMISDPDCCDDFLPQQAFVDHDMKYYTYLTEHGLTADNDAPVFSFVHLNCCHTVWDATAELYGLEGENDIYKTTRGDFEIIFRYMDELKRLGIYDNTTFIVLGDHGRAPRELKNSDTLDSAITSALLIKPAGAAREKLVKDRDTGLSLAYFSASILEYAGIGHSGYSFGDIVRGGISEPRYIRGYDFAGYGRMVSKRAYEVTGDARDFENWRLLDD
ncbi:MAG: sulfatase-like hydrolase/transferase [Ruminococcus sp.]|nr:sulfatase-like hydrolase/transferase [Ruminococcus sp.]